MVLFIRISILLTIFSSCASPNKTITSFFDTTPIYKYTNAENLDIFEITSYGTNSIEQLADNAKAQLIRLLLKNGYNGIKDFKPLVSNPLEQEKLLNEKYSILLEIINDNSCMSVDYKQLIKPIFLSKRKVYSKTFLVTISINNIKNKLKNLL
jgi:hypothetical protein